MQIPKFILGTLLAMAMLSAQAAPVTEDYSVSPGDPVTVVLRESTETIPFGMVITFGFDAAFLKLDAVRLGADWASSSVLSLFDDSSFGPTAFISGPSRGPGSLLELDFTIIDPPPQGTVLPYDTIVTFDCPEADSRCEEYVFRAPVVSTITIDQSTQIPLPGTLPLIALGMASLVWARRRMA